MQIVFQMVVCVCVCVVECNVKCISYRSHLKSLKAIGLQDFEALLAHISHLISYPTACSFKILQLF